MSDTGVVKRWGNSMALIIPADTVKTRKIAEGEEVVFTLTKVADLSYVFGTLKRKPGLSGQQFKDEAKAGWEK